MTGIDYAGNAYPVEGLGPGRRVVLWVRGCRRQCAGCMTPELWAAGALTAVEAVAGELLSSLRAADGLTISGGEPFEQADVLCALLDLLRVTCEVEVLAYTGYQLEEIAALGTAALALLARLDVLIDGPFVAALPNTLQWRGSDNQRMHLLSARAQRYALEVDAPMPASRPLQVQMLPNGACRIIGIPRRGDLEALAARGITRNSEF